MAESHFSESDSDERRHLGDDRPARALWPWIVVLLCVGILVIWRLSGPGAPREDDYDGTRHPAVGTRVGEAAFEPLVGEAQPLRTQDLSGKVTLINFWGPWCGPCLQEFPHLVELEKHFRQHDDFQFVSVSSNPNPADETGLAESTEQFVKQHGAGFPIYHDPEGRAQRYLLQEANFQVLGFPTTLLLNRDGTVRAMWVGYSSGLEREMREAVQAALDDRPAPQGNE